MGVETVLDNCFNPEMILFFYLQKQLLPDIELMNLHIAILI